MTELNDQLHEWTRLWTGFWTWPCRTSFQYHSRSFANKSGREWVLEQTNFNQYTKMNMKWKEKKKTNDRHTIIEVGKGEEEAEEKKTWSHLICLSIRWSFEAKVFQLNLFLFYVLLCLFSIRFSFYLCFFLLEFVRPKSYKSISNPLNALSE